MNITLIGFGVAGQLLLSHILESIDSSNITIIDPDFIGGDLAREYSAIQSNTTIGHKVHKLTLPENPSDWKEIATALTKCGPSDVCLPLIDLAKAIRSKAIQKASQCTCIYDTVTELVWSETTRQWTIHCASSKIIQSQMICLSTGMIPRQEDYGVPKIPLHIALDPAQLSRIVSKGDHVIVFGLSHSGTLILKHLYAIPTITTTGIYKGSEPFKFDRDGHYGGIKKESAEIADLILKGDYADRLTLQSMSQSSAIYKAIRSADWIIQAIGFQSRVPIIRSASDSTLKPVWKCETGECLGFPQILSFGACNPSETEVNGSRYPDISVTSFIDQINKRLPLLKQFLNQN